MKHQKRTAKSQMSVHILLAYMLLGITPMLLCSSLCIALFRQHYDQRENEVMQRSIQNLTDSLEALITHYASIAADYASEQDFIHAMQRSTEKKRIPISILSDAQIRQETDVQYHFLSTTNGTRYSTGSIPALYSMPTYKQYGVFADAQKDSVPFGLRATRLFSYQGRQIALSLAKAMENAEGEVVGFVVIDVFRDALAEHVNRLMPEGAQNVIITDARGVVAYSSNPVITEGETRKDVEPVAENKASKAEMMRTYLAELPPPLGLTLTAQRSDYAAAQMLDTMVRVTMAITVLTAITAAACSVLISRRVSSQIRRLTDAFAHARNNGLRERFTPHTADFQEIAAIGMQYNCLLEELEALVANMIEKQRRLNVAEVKALESQIKPHFLYNVLNDIKSLAKLGQNDDICALVLAFGTVLRQNLASQEEFIQVDEELHVLQSYVQMQNIRHEHTIRFRLDFDASLMKELIPRFLLQPLIENALMHGLITRPMKHLVLIGRDLGHCMQMHIVDNGIGFDAASPSTVSGPSGGLHVSIGLDNIRSRLRLYYGEHAHLIICSRTDCYTKVTLTVPKGRSPEIP